MAKPIILPTNVPPSPAQVDPPAKTEAPIKVLSRFLNGEAIKIKFTELLGERGPAFIASIISAANIDKKLAECEPDTVYTCALMAAALNLPISPSLGYAYLIPYRNNKAGIVECQFQISARGLKQLAQRSGQYKTINQVPVYEGQLKTKNPLIGQQFDFENKLSDKVIGFVSYFKLLNGFESFLYMTVDECRAHASRYSQTFKSDKQWIRDGSKWTTDFDMMALKTVTKLNLYRNGPMSVDMQRAIVADQAVLRGGNIEDVDYTDNTPEALPEVNKEVERALLMINDTKTNDELSELWGKFGDDVKQDPRILEIYNAKFGL